MAELLINGKDALSVFGVRMGDGFLDALNAPSETKAYISNESRVEHGKQIITTDGNGNSLVRLKSRDVNLTFNLEGNSREDFEVKKKAFYEELYKGEITLEAPDNNSNVYHFIYHGKGQSYAQDASRTFCKFTAKFEETNPMNRV